MNSISNPHKKLEKDYLLLSLILHKSKHQHYKTPLFRNGSLLKSAIRSKKSYKIISNRAIDLYIISSSYVEMQQFVPLAHVFIGISARCFVICKEFSKFD